ncbi:MAG: primosomal protein DnaI [bacterium]|nr:primosomal protein DnaI [bacterium]
MHNVLENLEDTKNVKIDLDKEYEKSKSSFKQITKHLNLSDDYLKKYTSILEECSSEFENCKNCKNLFDCKNKLEGYCYLPVNINNTINFTYKPCKYKEVVSKKTKHLDNVKYFNTPEYVKEASIDSIYKTDKERFETIKWLMDFKRNYESKKEVKGLYLNGNFGCGKTYLIAAIFNELAKKGFKSSIIFWPEFLRQVFYDDFNEKYEYVKKIPLLLIDDIGAEGLTAWNRDEILCPLLQYRMDNNLTTFFTSNLTKEELEIHLSNSKNRLDEVKAKRIISRIDQLTDNIKMVSKNLRK